MFSEKDMLVSGRNIDTRYQTPLGYRWNRDIVLPYESMWGIVNFFKYLNRLTNRDISTRHPKYFRATLVNEHVAARLNADFLVYDFAGTVGDDLYIPEDQFSAYRPPYSRIGTSLTPLRTEVWYCPVCMKKYAYHSYLHQVTGTENCFIHNEPLVRTGIPYAVDTDRADGPYQDSWYSPSKAEGENAKKFEFDDIVDLVNSRKRFRTIVKSAAPDRTSVFCPTFYRSWKLNEDKWNKKPFAVLSGVKDLNACLERYLPKDGGRLTPFRPDITYVSVRLEELEKVYGEVAVRLCLLASRKYGPGERYLKETEHLPPELARDCLLLLMLSGIDNVDGLFSLRQRSARITDLYGIGLYINFLAGLEWTINSSYTEHAFEKPCVKFEQDGSFLYETDHDSYRIRHPEEVCASLLIMEQFAKDCHAFFPDARSCCDYMNTSKTRMPPKFYYRMVIKPDGTVNLHRGEMT